jgi:5'-nucleotidase
MNFKDLKVRLFAINDFHGQLEVVPSTSSGGRVGDTPAGGMEYLSTRLTQLRALAADQGVDKTFTVAAGDLIGATPLLSAAFHDEPTIEAMNKIGLQITSVGNHEFDEGYKELKRMQKGGCLADGDGVNNQTSCPDATQPFKGADFKYLAANVKFENTNKPIFASYKIKKVKGQKVAFIGMTLKNTPNIVTKSAVQGLVFGDEVKTVNRLVPQLQKKGVNAMVVLLHEGAVPSDISDVNGCVGATGPGIEIAKALHPEIDVVVSGHTHMPYNCTVRDPQGKKRLITSAYSTGRVITELRLKLKGKNGEVIRSKSRALNRIVKNSNGTKPDAAITQLIQRYGALVAPIRDKVLGKLKDPATPNEALARPQTVTEDYELGNLIADSQKTDPSVVTNGKTPVIAFMNPGGIRSDLRENAAGDVTYGAAFSVQPFNNYVTSMDLTGEQILAVLNEQWNGLNEGARKILQPSGIQYTYDLSDAAGTGNAVVGSPKVDLDRDGTYESNLDPAATYRVVVNSFLADGGDGFATLAKGTDRFIGGLDIDALARTLASTPAYVPGPTDRITTQD